MAQKMQQGKTPDSKIVDHLFQYPLVSQSFDFYQKQPLGAKSLDVMNNIYAQTSHFFATPASYVAPYASKVDEFGDNTLSTVDNYIPAFKNTGFDTLHDYATFPLRRARDTYTEEYKRTTKRDGEGIISFGKAVISTEIRLASDGLHYVADFLGPRKDQVVENFESFKEQAQEQASNFSKALQGKLNEAQNTDFSKKAQELGNAAEKKTNEAADTVQKKANEASNTDFSKKAQETANTAEKKTKEAANTADKKANETAKEGEKQADKASNKAQQKKEQMTNGN